MAALLAFQTRWTECLHGAGALRETLSDLAALTGAQVVHLHRIALDTGRQRTISTLDRGAPDGARPLTQAVGPSLLAVAGFRVRPGSVWTLDDLDEASRDRLDQRCRQWLADRRIRDVAAIPLDRGETGTDLLELYFTAPLARPMRTLLDLVGEAVATAWSRREKGRIARLLGASPAISERLGQPPAPGELALLSPDNPCRLTAAETRICQMIQSGHSPTEIAERSRICESTLRTHLRSIYAKAEVSGHVGLVRLLLASEPAERAAARI